MEKSSRLTYFDMVNQSRVLQECDEETAPRACLEAIGPAAGQVPPAWLPRAHGRPRGW